MNQLVRILSLLLSAGAGIAAALLGHSVVAGIVIGWYIASLIDAVWATMRVSLRQVGWTHLFPRLVGTPIALLLARLLVTSLSATLSLAALFLLAIESLYRACLRRRRPDWFADQGHAAVSPWRDWAALSCALALVLLLPITLYAYVTRQTLTDLRVWAYGFNRWGIYETLLDLTAQELPNVVCQQPPLTRYALSELAPAVQREALTALLPPQWSEAVTLLTVESTLEWLQTASTARVPSISIPVGEVVQHAKRALSIALDDYIADLPICPTGTATSAHCRPSEMSVIAYTATFKPEALTAVDQATALIPPDVDLATAVTLSPNTFRSALASLAQLRTNLAWFDRLLGWAGLACMLCWVGVWAWSSTAMRAGLCWGGTALFVAGARAWSLSWLLTTLSPAMLRHTGLALKPPLDNMIEQAAGDLLRIIYARSVLPAALCALGGLILVWSSFKIGSVVGAHPRKTMNLFIVFVSLITVLWHTYLLTGRRQYEHAVALHRHGDCADAARLYRPLTALYPFAVDPFVTAARRGLMECQRDLDAQHAFDVQDFETAMQIDEALLVAAPAFALRERAETRLIAAMNAQAERLWATGQPERALDIYRRLAQEEDDRTAQRNLAQRCIDWGTALESEGDYAGAIATYMRITRETANARFWVDARTHAAAAYCAWAQALRAGMQSAQAESICATRATIFQPAELAPCPPCD